MVVGGCGWLWIVVGGGMVYPSWSVFSLIRSEYGQKIHISPYSVRMRENTDQNNSKDGHFSQSDR